MGSSYFGEPKMGNERSPSNSGGSSRKGKKNNSDKPKQPQRGLGVAQLEKIRLHGQMDCSYLPNSLQTPYPTTSLNLQEDLRVQTAYSTVPPASSNFSYSSSTSSPSNYGFHPNIMMGFSEMERPNIRYGDSQPSTAAARWNPGNNILESQNFAQPNITRHLLNLQGEDALDKRRKKNRSNSMSSSSQNSGSSDTKEPDLELRLSL